MIAAFMLYIGDLTLNLALVYNAGRNVELSSRVMYQFYVKVLLLLVLVKAGLKHILYFINGGKVYGVLINLDGVAVGHGGLYASA